MLTYVPVVASPYLTREWKRKKEITTWWTKDSIFKYDYLMVSYGNLVVSKSTNFANALDKFFEFRNDVKLYYDSGGWQVLTKNANVDPISLAHAQKNSHSDVAFILDVPPVHQHKKTIDSHYFAKCLEKTKSNIEKAYKCYDDFDGKLYGVLHGLTEEQHKQWYKSTIEEYEFDGVAVPYRMIPQNLAKSLSFLRMKGVKNIHIFSLSGRETMAFLGLISDFFDNISFDSSTSVCAGYKGEYILPFFVTRIYIGRKGRKEGINYDDIKCICPICIYIKEFDKDMEYRNLGSIFNIFVVNTHNMWWMTQYSYLLNTLVKYKREKIYDFVKNRKLISECLDIFEKDGEGSDLKRWI